MEYWLAERQLQGEAPVGPVYVLQGKESFLQARFLQQLRERLFPAGHPGAEMNTNEIDGATQGWQAALEVAQTLPFLAERRLVILRNPPGLAPGGSAGGGAAGARDRTDSAAGDQAAAASGDLEKKLLQYVAAPPPTTCFVIVTPGVDKRRRLYKLLEKAGTVVDCDPLKPADMPSWIRRRVEELGGRIDSSAADKLALQLVPDLHLVDQELHKLIAYAAGEHITEAAVAAVASASAEATIWPLLDAVGQKRATEALRLLRQLLQQGEPPLRLLFMLTRQWRMLLSCKVMAAKGQPQKEMAAVLGVPPFAVRNLVAQQRNFSREQVRLGMQALLETDVQLKSSPTDPRLLLELCVLGLCQAR